YSAVAGKAYLALERMLARGTAAVINVSASQEAEGLALRLFSGAQSHVIPNGIDVAGLRAAARERAAARDALGLPGDARVIGCASRLDPVKGVDVLLRAAVDIPRTEIAVIGGGAESARLRRLADALGLGGRTHFLGEIPDAATLFRAFDV